jgi:hypothetical protein
VLTERRPSTLGVAGLRASVAAVRTFAAVGAAIAALLTAVSVLLLHDRRRLLRRHRDLVVSVGVRPAGDIVDVHSFETLVEIATSEHCTILDDGDAFYVRAGETLHRYRPSRRDDAKLGIAPQLV